MAGAQGQWQRVVQGGRLRSLVVKCDALNKLCHYEYKYKCKCKYKYEYKIIQLYKCASAKCPNVTQSIREGRMGFRMGFRMVGIAQDLNHG